MNLEKNVRTRTIAVGAVTGCPLGGQWVFEQR